MSSFDFIIDNIRFSYSALTTYDTCPWSYKLTYIDRLPREENFYAQYGTLIHDCFYQYFVNKLEPYELTDYFKKNYYTVVNKPAPDIPRGMEERYIEQGVSFFNSFGFERDNYDVILAEEKIEFEFDDGVAFVAKPDLVLFEKNSGDFILYDYKSSSTFKTDKRTGKETADEEKLNGYYKQMYIYTYALRNYKFTPIDRICLWFTRPDKRVEIKWKEKEEDKAIRWLHKTVKTIKKDEKFLFNTENPYFCDNLCGMRIYCEYR